MSEIVKQKLANCEAVFEFARERFVSIEDLYAIVLLDQERGEYDGACQDPYAFEGDPCSWAEWLAMVWTENDPAWTEPLIESAKAIAIARGDFTKEEFDEAWKKA